MTHQFYFWAYTQKNWKKELNRYLHIQVHKSILNNSQEVEATQVSTGGWMDKYNVVYTYIHTMEYHSVLKRMILWKMPEHSC